MTTTMHTPPHPEDLLAAVVATFNPMSVGIHAVTPTAPIAFDGARATFDVELDVEGLLLAPRFETNARVTVDVTDAEPNRHDGECYDVRPLSSTLSPELDAALAPLRSVHRASVRAYIDEVLALAAGHWLHLVVQKYAGQAGAVPAAPAKASPPGRFLDGNEVAKVLGISKSSGYAVVRSLPHLQFGRTRRVERVVFEAWVKRNTDPGRSRRSLGLVPRRQLPPPERFPPIVPRTKPRV